MCINWTFFLYILWDFSSDAKIVIFSVQIMCQKSIFSINLVKQLFNADTQVHLHQIMNITGFMHNMLLLKFN